MKKRMLILTALLVLILLISAVKASTIGYDNHGLYLIFTGPRNEILQINQELQEKGFVLVDNRFTPKNIEVIGEGIVKVNGQSLLQIANDLPSSNAQFDLTLFNEIIAESRLHGMTIVNPITIDHTIKSKITGGRIKYPADNVGYIGRIIDDNMLRDNIRVSNAEYIDFRFDRSTQESTVVINFGRTTGYFYLASGGKMAEVFSPQNTEIIYTSGNPAIRFIQGGSTQTLTFKDIDNNVEESYYFIATNPIVITANWKDKTTTIATTKAGHRFRFGQDTNNMFDIYSPNAIASIELNAYGYTRISAILPDGTRYSMNADKSNLNVPINQLSNLGRYADRNQLSVDILSFPFFNVLYNIQNSQTTTDVSSMNGNVKMIIPKNSQAAEKLITSGYA